MKTALLIMPIIGVLLGAMSTGTTMKTANAQTITNQTSYQNGYNSATDALFYKCGSMNSTAGADYCVGYKAGLAHFVARHTIQNASLSGECINTVCSTDPWQQFGFFLNIDLLNIHYDYPTGVYHNTAGVFIPWSTLCNAQQSRGILQQSCTDLVNANGNLTPAGRTAVGCITNGAIITIGANKYHVPIDTVKGALGFLAGPTGCGGIVNLDTIQNFPQFQSLLNAMTPP